MEDRRMAAWRCTFNERKHLTNAADLTTVSVAWETAIQFIADTTTELHARQRPEWDTSSRTLVVATPTR